MRITQEQADVQFARLKDAASNLTFESSDLFMAIAELILEGSTMMAREIAMNTHEILTTMEDETPWHDIFLEVYRRTFLTVTDGTPDFVTNESIGEFVDNVINDWEGKEPPVASFAAHLN